MKTTLVLRLWPSLESTCDPSHSSGHEDAIMFGGGYETSGLSFKE